MTTYLVSGMERVWANDTGQTQITLRIAIADKPACAHFWWIVPVTAALNSAGTVCGSATLRTPSYFGFRFGSILVSKREAGRQIVPSSLD